jgi:hypothetical protein
VRRKLRAGERRRAISISASRLKPGAKVRDVVLPRFGEDVRPAFDAVDKYECGAGGQS